MEKQTMGEIISTLRKEKGMTQKELAQKMGVTDKAVSKWERNLSCPDISSIPRLADILGTTVDTLMNVKPKAEAEGESVTVAVDTILKAVPMGLSVALVVLSAMQKMGDMSSFFSMVGLCLLCLTIRQYIN